MRAANIIFSLIVATQIVGCDLKLNDEDVTHIKSLESEGLYYSYYSRQMWDGEYQYIIKTTSKSDESIKLHEIEKMDRVSGLVYENFKHGGSLSKTKFYKDVNGIMFCSSGGCINITKVST